MSQKLWDAAKFARDVIADDPALAATYRTIAMSMQPGTFSVAGWRR